MAKNPNQFRPADADDALSDLKLNSEPDSETAARSGQDATADQAARGGSTELDDLQEQLQQAKDRWLRTEAELENVRRRMQREMQEQTRFANQSLLVDLLPVLDNIERAIDAAQRSSEGGGLLEGFKMVQQLLLSTFERYHCTRVRATGQDFDPSLHEALAQMPSPDVPAGHVLHVSQEGYQLHDRVIRPAQVVVSSGPPG